jgi:hypothetical protein
MISSLNAIKQALAYARFEDANIKTAVNGLVDELQTELTGEQYEEGTAVEQATAILTASMDATDSQKEEAEEIDDDPFAGLGDDEEEENSK